MHALWGMGIMAFLEKEVFCNFHRDNVENDNASKKGVKDKRKAAVHRDAIQAFVDELRAIDYNHVYLPGYLEALETANNWLAKTEDL